jgi:hypothetical protein
MKEGGARCHNGGLEGGDGRERRDGGREAEGGGGGGGVVSEGAGHNATLGPLY